MPSQMPSVNEAMGQVGLWSHAVQIQAIRILTDGTGMPDGMVTRQMDSYLFAVALRNLLRAASLLRTAAPSAACSGIDLALNAFNQTVPRAVEVRDVLEHFDDYARGAGRLQGNGAFLINEWHERGPQTYRFTIAVVPGTPPLTIEVGEATNAANALVRALEDAVS
jgi:hypothetical protein